MVVANDANTHQRHVHRHDDTFPSLSVSAASQSPSSTTTYSAKSQDHEFSQQFTMALNISGIALSLLVTVFGLFHVDVFLRVYRLPLHAYSTGNLAFTVVNTSNDVLGAWLLDAAATRIHRSDLIGISG